MIAESAALRPQEPLGAPSVAPVEGGMSFRLSEDIQGILGGIQSPTERDALVEQILREGLRSRQLLNPMDELPF